MSWILKKNRVFKITGSGHGSFVKGFFIRIPVWKFLQPWWVKCSFRLLSKRLAAHCCSSLAGWTSHFSSLIYYFCEYTPRNPTTTYVVSRRVRDWHPMNSCHCHRVSNRGFITFGSPTSEPPIFFRPEKKLPVGAMVLVKGLVHHPNGSPAFLKWWLSFQASCCLTHGKYSSPKHMLVGPRRIWIRNNLEFQDWFGVLSWNKVDRNSKPQTIKN